MERAIVRAPGEIDGYAVLVLASLFNAALPHAAASQLQLIHYKQLPDLVFSDLLPRLGLAPSPAQLQAMRARRHAAAAWLSSAGNAAAPDHGNDTKRPACDRKTNLKPSPNHDEKNRHTRFIDSPDSV
jgi:hypothetical protein